MAVDWDRYHHLLGTVPDRVVAEAAGCSLSAVFFIRQRRGIPAFQRQRPEAKRIAVGELPDLGQAPDHEIAKRHGLETWEVRLARRAAGIPIIRHHTETLPEDDEDTRLRKRMARWTERDTESGCLNWTGKVDSHGYGAITTKRGRERAHRVAWRLAGNEITDDKPNICHRCDNRTCVEVSHLFAGTKLDNARDASRKDRYRKSYLGLPRGVRPIDYDNPDGGYEAVIHVTGQVQPFRVGSFPTVEEASAAYIQAKEVRDTSGYDIEAVRLFCERFKKKIEYNCSHWVDRIRCKRKAEYWISVGGVTFGGPVCADCATTVSLFLLIHDDVDMIPC